MRISDTVSEIIAILTRYEVADERDLHRPTQGPAHGPVHRDFAMVEAALERSIALFVRAGENACETDENHQP